jgi:hypothetical protein
VFYFDLVYSSYIIFNNKIILKQLFLFVNEFVNINLSDHLFSINLFSKNEQQLIVLHKPLNENKAACKKEDPRDS